MYDPAIAKYWFAVSGTGIEYWFERWCGHRYWYWVLGCLDVAVIGTGTEYWVILEPRSSVLVLGTGLFWSRGQARSIGTGTEYCSERSAVIGYWNWLLVLVLVLGCGKCGGLGAKPPRKFLGYWVLKIYSIS